MKDIWTYLKEQDRPVVLYGTGNGADKIIDTLGEYGVAPAGVFASESFVRGGSFRGIPVTDYRSAKAAFPGMIVLLAFGTSRPEVIENVKRIKCETELYAPEVPVAEGPVFTAALYEENKDKIAAARALLADGASRDCFDGIINYKLTGDIGYLFACQSNPEEPYKTFLRFSEDTAFVDLGAYRGDTALDYIKRAGKWRKIIAAEPDAKSFARLKTALCGFENVTLLNAAAYSVCGDIPFDPAFSRGAKISANGGGRAAAFTVDSLCLEGGDVYIKADIEGAEADFLAGARDTVARLSPKMRIAAYHKSADIFEIPLMVERLRPGYKIYLRHGPCLPAWDTDYFFIP